MDDLRASFIDEETIIGILDGTENSINGELSRDSQWDIGGQLTPPIVADYNDLANKPQIEGNILEGNKTFEDLSLIRMSNQEIENILIL